jgi:hypothetical protein
MSGLEKSAVTTMSVFMTGRRQLECQIPPELRQHPAAM